MRKDHHLALANGRPTTRRSCRLRLATVVVAVIVVIVVCCVELRWRRLAKAFVVAKDDGR